MLDGLSDWWDTVELWLAQLWFPLQFVLVVAVLAPLCLGAAWLIDRLVDRISAWFGSTRGEDSSGRP
ncbi:hypothetical protein [Amycolatopsis anabasis]|uniref:hypothetical protein n=1 Tax=Amycolatopsis anabasis TaxID=1840409 RepID=UPI00131D82C5|nr:hypothetical protein [Amycolatopsis anabasis]